MDLLILVLLGTQDKSFHRLLDSISEQIKEGNIKDKVIVQAGHTKYESKDMEIFDLIPTNELSELITNANLIITHGGVGSIMECIKNNKVIIAAPRLKKYNEHVNDHQIQIIEEFAGKGYLIPLYDISLLKEALQKASGFKAKKYTSNNEAFVKIIDEYINKVV